MFFSQIQMMKNLPRYTKGPETRKLLISKVCEKIIFMAYILRACIFDLFNYLTLTRPIGLPLHAPVAQKIADQR